MENNLNSWAENIIKETYLEWKDKYLFWKPGFKIFYSPLRSSPDLLIISFNPQGNAYDFEEDRLNFEKGKFLVPQKNEFITKDYLMAKKIRNFFKGNIKLLEESVIIPLIFFRSKDDAHFDLIELDIRNEMLDFSFEKTIEIIQKIKPKKILILGMRTYKILKESVGKNSKENNIYGNDEKIAVKANLFGIPTFAMKHPTGSRISNEDLEKIKIEFFNY